MPLKIVEQAQGACFAVKEASRLPRRGKDVLLWERDESAAAVKQTLPLKKKKERYCSRR